MGSKQMYMLVCLNKSIVENKGEAGGWFWQMVSENKRRRAEEGRMQMRKGK
jgi:hypothetical protein